MVSVPALGHSARLPLPVHLAKLLLPMPLHQLRPSVPHQQQRLQYSELPSLLEVQLARPAQQVQDLVLLEPSRRRLSSHRPGLDPDLAALDRWEEGSSCLAPRVDKVELSSAVALGQQLGEPNKLVLEAVFNRRRSGRL